MSLSLDALLKNKKLGCTSLALDLITIFENTLSSSSDKNEFIMRAEIIHQKVKEAHPSIYGLHNVWYSLSQFLKEKSSLEECKIVLQGFKMKVIKGIDEVTRSGADVIQENDHIMTISNSFLVRQAAIHAAKKHEFSFFCLRSLPGGEGEEMMFSLNKKNIFSSLVEDHEVGKYLAKTKKILISCDALFENKFINKKGTLSLVQHANQMNIPVFVIASPLVYVNINFIDSVKVDEKLFEEIPLSNVKLIK